YYRALRRAQLTLDSDESQLIEWLRFFLLCLVQQKNSLARKLERERLMGALPELDEQILQLVRQHGRLTLREALHLTRANRNTLKLHLRQLVQIRRLKLLGTGRSSWYVAELDAAAAPAESVRQELVRRARVPPEKSKVARKTVKHAAVKRTGGRRPK